MFNTTWTSLAKWSLTAAALTLGFGAFASDAQAQYGYSYSVGYPGVYAPAYTIGPNYGNRVYVAPPAYRVYRAPIYSPPIYTAPSVYYSSPVRVNYAPQIDYYSW